MSLISTSCHVERISAMDDVSLLESNAVAAVLRILAQAEQMPRSVPVLWHGSTEI